ncbi:DUF6950 family protein [Variovorax boronicumulans]|uniref:DUF6950 family protein n=1 Tax=Variovorax boronicumulans TaxID=436515 RepID=UPI0027853246|nr:hypothetical protein [Variovorax boronicumulans]MDQ0040813.1 hypothetical protein [Variovorax boronicumulans]
MRRADWQERFAAFAKERAEMPFAWGTNDCCTFAAGAVLAITGKDPMASFEPYDSPLAAARLVETGGGLSVLACSLLGPSVPPLMAAVGDVVLLTNEGRELLGVCNGPGALAPGKDGAVIVEMTAALAAWKI